MNNITRALPFLCDPVDLSPLRFEKDESGNPYLSSEDSGRRYYFVGDIPDLRPDAGIGPSEIEKPQILTGLLAEKHEEVLAHYDDAPCNNYLALDNIPLGRWLRDPEYTSWFEDLSFPVEVGSGKGAIATAFKEHRNVELFCIDLAYGSLHHVLSEPLEASAALGSNLQLPIHDNCVDLLVSYGVIHHTPDPVRCMIELARVLKPGGRLLLGVYNWDNLYRPLYFFFSPPFRAVKKLLGKKLGDLFLQLTVFLPYHIALWFVLMIVQRRFAFPDIKSSWEQFGDFFLSPFVRFYTKEEMISLAEILGLELVEHATGGWPQNGFAHFYWFIKGQ